MASFYRYVLDDIVVESLMILSFRQRDHFVTIFRQLADDPFQRGESFFLDSSGREVQKKQFGQWTISYWADHAVKEIRIVGLQRARP